MSFLWVLWFLPKSQKHASRWMIVQMCGKLLQWTVFLTRVYTCLEISVLGIHTGSPIVNE